MQSLRQFAVLLVLIIFAVIGNFLSASDTDPKDNAAGQGMIGPWRADSVALTSGKGAKTTLPNNGQQPLNITISDKTMTMRAGVQQIAEMSYVLDAAQTPAAIDVKFQDQDMQGICELKGDVLRISLNDAIKGRPKDLGQNENGMDIVLHRFKGEPLMMINSDGTNLHRLLSLPDYTSCGSPEWSHDGNKITFDCWRSVLGESYSKSHVFVVNADGSSPKDLGEGTLPSWSPDGKRIAYCRYSPNNGVWIMNADGSENHLIDPQGWGPDWSPKNDELAYSISGNDGVNLCVRDLNTQGRRSLLEKKYGKINGGLSWSPDGQWICFRGELPNGSPEAAIVHAEDHAKGFKVLFPNKDIPGVKEIEKHYSWSPDGKQILAPIRMEGDTNLQLYIIDPEGKTPPKKLAGQDPSCRNYGSSWSPDGKKIVISFWPGNPVGQKAQTTIPSQRILILQ
jgi:TolB protein